MAESLDDLEQHLLECADHFENVYSCKHQASRLLQRVLAFEIPAQRLTHAVLDDFNDSQMKLIVGLVSTVKKASKLLSACSQDNFIIESCIRAEAVAKFHDVAKRFEKIAIGLPCLGISSNVMCISALDHSAERLDWIDSMRTLKTIADGIRGKVGSSEEEEYQLKLLQHARNCLNKVRPVRVGLRRSNTKSLHASDGLVVTSLHLVHEIDLNAPSGSQVQGKQEHQQASKQGFGLTYRGVWKHNLLCIKKIDPKSFRDGFRGVREAATLAHTASHGCEFLQPTLLVHLYPDLCYWVSELAPLGTLHDLLYTGTPVGNTGKTVFTPITVAMKYSLLLDTAYALDHLHSAGIVHGRLKAANILLYKNFRAKVSDYGVQSLLTGDVQRDHSGDEGWRWTSPESAHMLEASRIMELPERDRAAAVYSLGVPDILDRISYYTGVAAQHVGVALPPLLSPKEDCYAFGVLIVSILSRAPPFPNLPWRDSVFKTLLEGGTPHLPSSYEDQTVLKDLESLATHCMTLEPEKRPDMAEHIHALEGWLSKVEFDRVGELRKLVNADVAALEAHIQLLSSKLEEDREVLEKGTQRIAVKAAEKDFMNSNKERRERDEMLDRARGKLKVIEEEIEEIQGEINNSEEQLDKKKDELRMLEMIAHGGPTAVLQQREFENDYNVQGLLTRYVSAGEIELTTSYCVPRDIQGTEDSACRTRMNNQLREFVESGLEGASPEVVEEDEIDGVDWHTGPMKFTEDITVIRACDQMAVQFDESFPQVCKSIRKNKIVVVDSIADSGVLGAGIGKRDADSDDEDGGHHHHHHHATGGVGTGGTEVSATAARHLTKNIPFALKAALRVLKNNRNAQYMCAAVGSIEEGVGMSLAGRTMERMVLEDYVNKGMTPLHVCALLGHTEALSHLVNELGLDVHEIDKQERSVLHHACTRGQLEMVRVIVQTYRVDIDIVDSAGFSALTYAAIGGYVDIARLLVEAAKKGSEEHSRRLKQVDYTHKASLLHWSVMSGRLAIVKYFLNECKLSVEQKTGTDGCTPIFWAAYSSSLVVCKYLVETASANLKRKDSRDQGIAHYAAAGADLEKMHYFIVMGGVPLLSIADQQANKAVDVAGSAYAAEFIKTIKKANGTKAKLTGGMM